MLAWLASLMGFSSNASGLLVTGGSMANVLGVTVARYAALKRSGTTFGSWDCSPAPAPSLPGCVLWIERDSWLGPKGGRALGLGNAAFHRVPVDSDYRLDLAALGQAVARDRAEGALPCCIIGTAATVNTGAIDDLAAVADFCQQENIWFSHGRGVRRLAATLGKSRTPGSGIERADSLAFDLHKWGYLPFECACVLVQESRAAPWRFHGEGQLPR